jgi:RimJ/RimL family protein N-acetyltransferase
MRDYGGLLDRPHSDAKFDRYVAAYERGGFSRWALETLEGSFVGYAGVMTSPLPHPLGPHAQIGWRLMRSAWGHGYATEASETALRDAFARCGLTKIFAYTGPDNSRSQAVMARLRLRRDPSRDFTERYGAVLFRGLVWVATRSRTV